MLRPLLIVVASFSWCILGHASATLGNTVGSKDIQYVGMLRDKLSQASLDLNDVVQHLIIKLAANPNAPGSDETEIVCLDSVYRTTAVGLIRE
jgi:hypothetical protein